MWLFQCPHGSNATTTPLIGNHARAGANAELTATLYLFVGAYFAECWLLGRRNGIILIEIFQHLLVGPTLQKRDFVEINSFLIILKS